MFYVIVIVCEQIGQLWPIVLFAVATTAAIYASNFYRETEARRASVIPAIVYTDENDEEGSIVLL